jgi:hypothetical protein
MQYRSRWCDLRPSVLAGTDMLTWRKNLRRSSLSEKDSSLPGVMNGSKAVGYSLIFTLSGDTDRGKEPLNDQVPYTESLTNCRCPEIPALLVHHT